MTDMHTQGECLQEQFQYQLQDYIIAFLEAEDISSVLKLFHFKTNFGIGFRRVQPRETVVYSESSVFIGNAQSYPVAEIERIYDSYQVKYKESLLGTLFLDCSPIGEKTPILEALLIRIIMLAKQELEITRKERSDRFNVLEKLLRGEIDSKLEFEKEISKLVVPRNVGWSVLILSDLPVELENLVMNRLRAFSVEVYWISREKWSVFILALKEKDPELIDQNISQIFTDAQHQLSLNLNHKLSFWGIGKVKDTLFELHESYVEAYHSMIYAILNRSSEPVSWHKGGVFRLFGKMSTFPESREFLLSYLDPLLKYDEFHQSDLFKTLLSIESSDWNLSSASKELLFHYNTIRYRYNKIQEILKIDLEKGQNRFAISLAIKLYNIQSVYTEYAIF